MKTLIVVIHPNLNSSVINKRWVQELQKHPDKFVVHNLYSTYPDGIIDIEKEQQLIESFNKIIFQFTYVKANYQPLFAYYGIELNAQPERIEKSVLAYSSYLAAF